MNTKDFNLTNQEYLEKLERWYQQGLITKQEYENAKIGK